MVATILEQMPNKKYSKSEFEKGLYESIKKHEHQLIKVTK
jgi:hypothetical protein